MSRKCGPGQFKKYPILFWGAHSPIFRFIDITEKLLADMSRPLWRFNAWEFDEDSILALEKSVHETLVYRPYRVLRDRDHSVPVMLNDLANERPHGIPEHIVNALHKTLELAGIEGTPVDGYGLPVFFDLAFQKLE